MSGEIVIITTLGAASVPILVGACALAAGVLIYNWVKIARKRKEDEKRRQKKWAEFQVEQRRKIENLAKVQTAVQQAAEELAELTLAEPRKKMAAGGEAAGDGFLDLVRKEPASREDTRPLFDEISSILNTVPDEFKNDVEWPFERFNIKLRRFAEALDQDRPPSKEELLTFKEAVSRTLLGYLKDVEDRSRAVRELFENADDLLDDVLVYIELASRSDHQTELVSIRDKLIALPDQGKLDWGDLDLLSKRMAKIREEIDHEMEWRAYRQTLADSVTRHLNEMGYQTVRPFERPDRPEISDAVMTIPGGEMLHAAIRPNGQMAFNVVPEKLPASAEDMTRYRAQEDKWCSDFRELLRRLTQDGFSFQVEMERTVPEEAIHIVDLVTADELASEDEAYREEPRLRRLDE